VAKKRTSNKGSRRERDTARGRDESQPANGLTADERAQAALRRAETLCAEARDRAAERLEEVTLADVLDGTRRVVRRYPATTLLVAGALGFYLGRATRR
jgi:hypothetical protein